MTSNQYDAIIIGGGHNGLEEALIRRQHAPAKVVKLPFYKPE